MQQMSPHSARLGAHLARRLDFVLCNQVLGRNDEARSLLLCHLFSRKITNCSPDQATAFMLISRQSKTNSSGRCARPASAAVVYFCYYEFLILIGTYRLQ